VSGFGQDDANFSRLKAGQNGGNSEGNCYCTATAKGNCSDNSEGNYGSCNDGSGGDG
jgi:hypothetical protein